MMKMQLQETFGTKWLWSWLLHKFVIVVVDCNFRFSNGAYGFLLCYWSNECDDDVIVIFYNDENRKNVWCKIASSVVNHLNHPMKCH
jgi:hypothetical protein